MTKRDVASLGLKLLGVYAVLSALLMLPVSVMMFSSLTRAKGLSTDAWWTVGGTCLSFIVSLLAGYWLISGSDSLAVRMVPDNNSGSPASGTGIESREWHALAFSVVGLTVCLLALPRLASFAVQLISTRRNIDPEIVRWTNHNLWTNGIVPIVQLILGLIVFFKARTLVGFWRRCQAVPK